MDKKDFSFSMAARLKQLREERGLSHQKLSDTLDEMLGISISKDSLMKYEVATEHHSTPFKNLGMRVEYLTALASFYNVSTDYILGLTDIRSPSIDTQAIIAQTGLTEENVKTLEAFQSIPATANLTFINEFLPVLLEGEAMIHYLLLKQTLKMPKPVNWNELDFDELTDGEIDIATGASRLYGYVQLTGKEAFEYHCSRLADEIEKTMKERFMAEAKWGEDNGID